MISGMLQKTIVHMMVTGIHFHWTEEIIGWVYNVDMFDKCGIEVPEDGFTWDEFTEACKNIDGAQR